MIGTRHQFHDLEAKIFAHLMQIKNCLTTPKCGQGLKLILLFICNTCANPEIYVSYITNRDNLLGNVPPLVADESFLINPNDKKRHDDINRDTIASNVRRLNRSDVHPHAPHDNEEHTYKEIRDSEPGQSPPSHQDTNTVANRMNKVKNFLLVAAFFIPTVTVSRIALLLTLFFELMSRKRAAFVHMYLLILPVTFTVEIFETLAFWCKAILYYIQILFSSPSTLGLTIVGDLICNILSLAAFFSLRSGLPMNFSLLHVPVICALSILYGSYANIGIGAMPFLRYVYTFMFLTSLVAIYFGVIRTKSKYNEQPKKDFVDWYWTYKSGSSTDYQAGSHHKKYTRHLI